MYEGTRVNFCALRSTHTPTLGLVSCCSHVCQAGQPLQLGRQDEVQRERKHNSGLLWPSHPFSPGVR